MYKIYTYIYNSQARGRKEKSKVINAVIKRSGGELTLNLNSAYMHELQIRTDENYNDQYMDGVIFSEAKTRAGSADQLLQDVRTGQVKKSTNEDGITLYHFPRGKMGRRQAFGSKVVPGWVLVPRI